MTNFITIVKILAHLRYRKKHYFVTSTEQHHNIFSEHCVLDLHAIQQFSFECPKTEPNLLFSANDNKRGQWNKRIKKNHVCFARENANEQKAIVFSFARLDENFARDLFFRSLRLVKDKTQISKSDQTWLPSSL